MANRALFVKVVILQASEVFGGAAHISLFLLNYLILIRKISNAGKCICGSCGFRLIAFIPDAINLPEN